MTNRDSILKSRDITLPTKVRLVKAMDLHIGATQTSPPLQNQSVKGAECEARSTTGPGLSSRRKKTKLSIQRKALGCLWPHHARQALLVRVQSQGSLGTSRGSPEPVDSQPTLPGAFAGHLRSADWAPLVHRPFPSSQDCNFLFCIVL